ncbi:MAG TPA: hypothetical protein VJ276_16365 [Thermoanaerobaculia bacterium]|nr:hypothetical protein [Thermoanaerobaculia bacterium]
MPVIVAACVVAVAIPARGVLDLSGALAFGVLVAAWLLLARPIVAGTLAYGLKGVTRQRLALVVSNLFVDSAAVIATVAILPQLVWSTLVGVFLTEAFYAVMNR